MQCNRSPRRWAHGLVASLTAAGLLGLPTASDAGVAAAPRLVRLTPDDAPGVRSAEVRLGRGLNRLRTTSYSLVAATWHGPAPRIAFRTSAAGRWQRLPVLEDRPDTDVEGRAGLGATQLLWTGPATGIEVRVLGDPARDVELVLIDPGTLATDDETPVRTATRAAARTGEPDRAPRPGLRHRKDWGADPSWRNGQPVYLDRMKQVHLHHTATGNRYRRGDVPGIIRGMYRYHTQTLGWFDIGYNFLIDKFGRTWVGRSGGPRRLVRGAHTLGFNHASVGISVIGNFERKEPGRDVVRAVKRLAAWKFDKHDRDARRRVWVRSSGSDKYADGRLVRLQAFDGHRDTNDTACPGQQLYDTLPRLRRVTQRRIDHFS